MWCFRWYLVEEFGETGFFGGGYDEMCVSVKCTDYLVVEFHVDREVGE